MLRACEENERGAHSDKNASCGNTREEKKREAKPKMERRMQERHDRGGAERGQRNKQGRIEDDRQLYMRSQMTGQAMDEDKEDVGLSVRSL